MKTINPIFWQKFILILVLSLNIVRVTMSQNAVSITGELKNAVTQEYIPFANINLYNGLDSTIVQGALSNLEGFFKISYEGVDKVFLRISIMGFETKIIPIEAIESSNLGHIFLMEEETYLNEIIIEGERMKGIAEGEKLVYYVNKHVVVSSNTGGDILNLIPGLHLDFKQNVVLNGKTNILIFVNGMEQDINFVQQLRPEQIDRIEIIANPSSKYLGDSEGAINIILSKNEPGISGNVYVETPVSGNEIYNAPTYSFSLNSGRFNFYTSYNGGFSYFDVNQNYVRDIFGSEEIRLDQSTRQKSWSHKFHHGVEYTIDQKNILNLYFSNSVFSEEHDGNLALRKGGHEYWSANREEEDRNNSLTTALFYKHLFDNQKDHFITFDLSHSLLKGENTVVISNEQIDFIQLNTFRPFQRFANSRVDYNVKLNRKLRFNTGFQYQFSRLENGNSSEFQFQNANLSAYGIGHWASSDWDIQAGLRAEEFSINLQDGHALKEIKLLPNFQLGYKISEDHTVRLFFRRSITYPQFHQLNPFLAYIDPFTVSYGNPRLSPFIGNALNMEHVWIKGDHFLATRAFLDKRINAINSLLFLGDNDIIETNYGNLGNRSQFGIQSSGAWRVSSKFSLNHSIRLFQSKGEANQTGQEFQITDQSKFVFESGISGVMALNKDIFISLRFHYLSPENDIQSLFFSGPLYFIAAEKKFSNHMKIGLTSGLPFSKTLTFYGLQTKAIDFSQKQIGKIELSTIPLWITFSYNFKKGIIKDKSKTNFEEGIHVQKKGF